MPTFTGNDDYRARLDDVDFWTPYVERALRAHGLADGRTEPVAGVNPTFPTFLYGDVVVKFLGHVPTWPTTYAGERAALALVGRDPAVLAPRLRGAGRLSPAWAYLILDRVPGVEHRLAGLSRDQQHAVAAQLGVQISRLHRLPTAGLPRVADWPVGSVTAAAARSSLPAHLVGQVESFLAGAPPVRPVVVHGDINEIHVYVEGGRLVGLIDWGDTVVADPHYELIQIYRGLFACDRTLFRTFLEAEDWPTGPDFPRRALTGALRRHALLLAQHGGRGDVFEPIAAAYPLTDIATLDDLATVLFDD